MARTHSDIRDLYDLARAIAGTEDTTLIAKAGQVLDTLIEHHNTPSDPLLDERVAP